MRTTIVRLTDDLDGSEAAETVRFGLDGIQHEIDLSEVHAKELRDLFAPYVEAGRRHTGSSTSRPAVARATSRAENNKIRQWAWDNGKDVAERGRIPQGIIDEYRAAA